MQLEFFNPSGRTEIVHSHAPRLESLAGRRIGFLSNGDWQSYRSFPLLRQHLADDCPSSELLPLDAFPEGTNLISQDDTIAVVRNSGVDAVIVGNAACGACSTACGIAAAKLEAAGIPTVTITREEFVGVVRNAASGCGVPPDLSLVTFPIDLFLPNSDLAPVSRRREEIYRGLTSWQPLADDGSDAAVLTVVGRDYEDSLRKANEMFLINGWGDGLPLWPATRQRVEWILQGSDLPRDHLLGKFPPRGGLATVEACAIALAMTGGRPEYLGVLIAAVDALLDPDANADLWQATSAATVPVVLVNGPVAKAIRLNSGFGCLGPSPQNSAGASIGRALRQLQQNLGGAVPGTGTMAPWGALRYTNLVFAEDEEGLPAGWLPHGTERHGFSPGTNSISFFWATGATNIVRRGAQKETLEEDVLQGLLRIADYMAAPSAHYPLGYDSGTPGALLLTRVVAHYLASTGFTQASVRQFLWDHSQIPLDKLQRNGMLPWIELHGGPVGQASLGRDPWPITSRPDNIILAVAGGAHPTHAFWLQSLSAKVIGRTIALPEAFGSLVSQADRDLGSGGAACAIA